MRFPSCTGTPRFPVTGPLRPLGGQRYEYTRSCDAFGACGEWTLAQQRWVSRDHIYPIYIEPDRSVRGALNLRYENSQSGSSIYRCTTRDTLHYFALDAAAKGPPNASMRQSTRCDIQGGSGGPSSIEDFRPVDVAMGATCLSIADRNPTPVRNFGNQRKVIYIVELE